MLSWINQKIDYFLTPEPLRPENLKELPHGEYVPIPSDIVLPSFAMAVVFVFARQLLDRFVVFPVGSYFGLKDHSKRQRAFDNHILEVEYKKSRNPKPDVFEALSKKTGFTERHIQMWFRWRKHKDRTSGLKKLSDSAWSFVFYISLSWYGIYVLWDKPWFNKTEDCWKGWPLLPVTNDIYWYYLLELAYYISYIYMLFTDHKRKDFLEFFIHHNITVVLMMLSWSVNVVRIGTLVVCLHDPVDYILTFAKSCIYIKKQGLADLTFVAFIILWVVTRLIIYPYVILYSVYVELPELAKHSEYVQTLDSYLVIHLLKALLVVLQVLHVIWTILIIKTAALKMKRGKLEDARSDTEEDDADNLEIEDEKELDRLLNNNM